MRLIITSILVFISVMGVSQTARDLVREGNKDYKIDSLNRAITSYENALTQDPMLEEAKFNLGDAFYKSGKFADAAKTFNELAQSSERKGLKSDAYYNEGNSLMQTQEFEKAMGSYKNSMIANPQNSKARYNYEYARRMLKEQQKQEQENEDKKDDKDQDKDDKNKDDKDKDKKDDKKDGDEDSDKDKDENKDKDQDKDSDKNKDKEEDKKDGDQDKDKGDEEEDKGKPDEQDGKDGKDEKQEPQPQPGQMSKADAERLLKAMEDNEKKTRAKVAKMKAKSSKTKKSDKDW